MSKAEIIGRDPKTDIAQRLVHSGRILEGSEREAINKSNVLLRVNRLRLSLIHI